ncbi:hypothetical protein CRM22_006756 [Opisthorchis felineus]|nr:hypothetical protein CRM22_006756 [Opisthorchis felineus]
MQGLMAKSRRVLFGEWLSPSHCDSPQICKSVDPQCPLMEGQWHTYSTTINTHKSYSRVSCKNFAFPVLRWCAHNVNEKYASVIDTVIYTNIHPHHGARTRINKHRKNGLNTLR